MQYNRHARRANKIARRIAKLDSAGKHAGSRAKRMRHKAYRAANAAAYSE